MKKLNSVYDIHVHVNVTLDTRYHIYRTEKIIMIRFFFSLHVLRLIMWYSLVKTKTKF